MILVAVQLGAIVLVFVTGPLLATLPLYLVLEMFGGLIGVWALVAMRLATFSVMPDVKATGQLIRQGPYRWIRHPMYLAVLLVTGALVADTPTWPRLVIWGVLLLDILLKIHHEERLLVAHYPAYATYRQQSKRLIPYLY